MDTHAHMVDTHEDLVEIYRGGSKNYYKVTCMVCGESHQSPIKPGYSSDAFVKEYNREIRVVGCDMLLSHLLGAHPDLYMLGDTLDKESQ
jgi:hypothetical protein